MEGGALPVPCSFGHMGVFIFLFRLRAKYFSEYCINFGKLTGNAYRLSEGGGVTSVTKKGNWKGILLAGAIASLLNTRTCNPLRHGRWPKHGMDNDNLGFHDRGCFRFIFPDDRYDLCIPLN